MVVALTEDLRRTAEAAVVYAEPGEELTGIVPSEPGLAERVYLCAYTDERGTSWLALDGESRPVLGRTRLRAAVSIAAMCELAEEVAGGGDLEQLRSQLVTLRLTENPPGIAEAEEAALALEGAIGAVPRVASPAHLDAVGVAARRLEQALGEGPGSPFAESMKSALATVEELLRDVEGNYKVELEP